MGTLSERSRNLLTTKNFLKDYSRRMSETPPFDPINAASGFINFGISENRLVDELLVERFLSTDMNSWLPSYQYYFNFQGVYELREALADFFQDKLVKNSSTFKIEPNCIAVTSGASSCFALLSYVIADPSEYVLVETPYYRAIASHIHLITNNLVYLVNSTSESNFNASVNDYERALDEAERENKKIKAIFMVTPGNPIGKFFNKEKMLGLLQLAKSRELHVVIDEIYANCIYENEHNFESILSYFDEIPDPQRTHFIWSFSKAFCSAGLRCGAIYSQNESVVKTVAKMGILFSPSCAIQHKLSIMLKDKTWIDQFFATSFERIRNSKEIMLQELDTMNVEVLDTNTGFFLFADFKAILSPNLNPKYITFERERQLFDIIFNNDVYIIPGKELGCVEPGWFRIVFTLPEEHIKEGVNRMKRGVEEFIKNYANHVN